MPINPDYKLGDPNYRWYNCNLQAPHIKCRNLYADSVNMNNSTDTSSGIVTNTGFKRMSTTHTFTTTDIPHLSNAGLAGEFTCYMQNHSSDRMSTAMAGLTKVNNKTVCNIYQRLGNFTTITSTTTNADSFIVTVSPPADCRWIFRGF